MSHRRQPIYDWWNRHQSLFASSTSSPFLAVVPLWKWTTSWFPKENTPDILDTPDSVQRE